MKNRLQRVCRLIQKELSDIFVKESLFPNALVTISDVDITPDLRQCHIYISVLGSSDQEEKILAQLVEKRGALQQRLSQRVVLKYTPHLHFKIDHSVERGVRVVNLLEELDLESEDELDEDFPSDTHPST